MGLPNVGKSTLFNCLSSAKAQAANFPFCTIDAQMGQVSVPDERLTKLAELVHPGRIVPAVCDIVDIAGLVKGASKGEGLGAPARAKDWATSSWATSANAMPSSMCCAASTTAISSTWTAR